MSEVVPNPERAVLSADFNALLIELSVALHKQAMYPSGHPSLEPAAAAVARSATRILEQRDQISFGVARRQLIIEGVATDPNQPVLRRLAEGLNRHHLGAISILRGINADEIGSAMRALAADAERDGPLGLIPSERLPAWPHLKLHPLTFDRLTLAADSPLAAAPGAKPVDSRGAELWIGLARAALAADEARPLGAEDIEPTVIARAIDLHPSAKGYDQVVVGHLLQIARELKVGTDAESAALRRRTGNMVAAMQPDTLRRLVEMGGDLNQRHAFVRDAASGMAVGAVLEIVKAAADAGGQTISHGLVRMLAKLASQAEGGGVELRPLADGALREQVVQLLSGWELADPNPEDYGQLLQHVAAASDRPRRPSADQVVLAEPVRMAQMSLELDASGPLLRRALERSIGEGKVAELLQLLRVAPEGCRAAADAIRAKLLEPDTIRALMTETPIDFATLDELLPSLPLESHQPLLDALAESDDRLTRRKLMDRLAHPSVDIGPLIAHRLEDERWFVVRNMLALLEQSGRIPAGFSAARWTSHPDARVRHQAIRLQLMLPAERDQAVRTALEDPDPRLARLGLTALRQECPPALAGQIVRIAETATTEDDVRLLAVRTLGQSREPSARDALLRMVPVTRTWFWQRRLAPTTPVLLAALEALTAGWSTDSRVVPILALAHRSSEAAVREAARRVPK